MNVIENFSKGGFVGQVQPNSLIHADCLDAMKYIESKSIDMILCDLPYGTTKCKWDTIIPFEPLWKQYERIIKKNGAIVLFGSEPFSSNLRMSNLKMYKYDWYWDKKHGANFAQANKRPLKNIETISVFYKTQPTYNAQKTNNPKGEEKRHTYSPSKQKEVFVGQVSMTADYAKSGKEYEPDKLLPKCLIAFSREHRPQHPTQKPVALCEYLIKTYTNENEVVLDNCAGSFTTAVACDNTNRNWICIEKEEEYCNIGLTRINDNRERLSLPKH